MKLKDDQEINEPEEEFVEIQALEINLEEIMGIIDSAKANLNACKYEIPEAAELKPTTSLYERLLQEHLYTDTLARTVPDTKVRMEAVRGLRSLYEHYPSMFCRYKAGQALGITEEELGMSLKVWIKELRGDLRATTTQTTKLPVSLPEHNYLQEEVPDWEKRLNAKLDLELLATEVDNRRDRNRARSVLYPHYFRALWVDSPPLRYLIYGIGLTIGSIAGSYIYDLFTK